MGDIDIKDIITVAQVLDAASTSEVKLQALEVILGLTGSTEGLEILYSSANHSFDQLVYCFCDGSDAVANKAAKSLINIAAEKTGANLLLTKEFFRIEPWINHSHCKNSRKNIVCVCLQHILNENSLVTSSASTILSNLTRYEENAQKVFNTFEDPKNIVTKLSECALRTDLKYDYVSSVLANLSQLSEIRRLFINSNQFLLQRLLPIIERACNAVRKNAVISIIRNLCLSVENHYLLLDPEIDLLPRLLLPLAGPEEFDDEDNDKLPLDLQYLPSNKTRDPDPMLRKMLLEILMQLCATKSAREKMRHCNVYVILRELHKWEQDPSCIIVLEDLVNILIRTEDEIGFDNLKELDVPSDLSAKFSQAE